MSPRRSSWPLRTGQGLVLIGLALLLWQSVDGAEAMALLGSVDPLWVGLAALVLTAQTVLSALRWRLTAQQLGLTLSRGTALREYYLAQTVNQSLPGGVVGDAGRAVRSRQGAGLWAAGQAVIFERVAGQLGLLAVLCAGLALTALFPPSPPWPIWVTTPLAIVWGVTVLLCLAAGLLGTQVATRLPDEVRRTWRAFRHALFARDVALSQIALSLGTALCNVVAFALCARAVGVPMPVVVVTSLVPLILFAMVLPLSIAGWGLREGAAALLFPVFGATMSAGLATSVTFGLVFLLATLPGLVLTWIGLRATPVSASDP